MIHYKAMQNRDNKDLWSVALASEYGAGGTYYHLRSHLSEGEAKALAEELNTAQQDVLEGRGHSPKPKMREFL